MVKKTDLKRAIIYIGITFFITYGYCFLLLHPVIRGESLSGVPSMTAQLLTALVMFFPALGVLITRALTDIFFIHAIFLSYACAGFLIGNQVDILST